MKAVFFKGLPPAGRDYATNLGCGHGQDEGPDGRKASALAGMETSVPGLLFLLRNPGRCIIDMTRKRSSATAASIGSSG
jgi:hypothetical protein